MQKLADTLPSSDDSATTRAVLRDGSVAVLKIAEPSDHDAVQRFFHELSPPDLDPLRELLLRVSRLAVDVPEIAELDLNPVLALPPATARALSTRGSQCGRCAR